MSGSPHLDRLRGSTLTIAAFGGLLCVWAALGMISLIGSDAGPRRERAAALAGGLTLTDVALFTEARYTRNPSLADLHTPFQDGPASLEHFPTASLIVAPRGLPAGRIEVREE